MKSCSRRTASYILALTLLMLITGMGILRLKDAGKARDVMLSEAMQKESLSKQWLSEATDNGGRMVALMRSAYMVEPDAFQKTIASSSQKIADIEYKLSQLKMDSQESQLLMMAVERREAYVNALDAVFKAQKNGNIAATRNLIETRVQPVLDAYLMHVHRIHDFQKMQIDKSVTSIDSHFQYGSLLLIAFNAIAILLSICVADIVRCFVDDDLTFEIKHGAH